MEKTMLSGVKPPFCPGCSNVSSVKYLSKALTECGYNPLDVVMVSDIGCSGLVDPLFNTHTIHGLHGRSAALATGVVLGMENPNKKVVVIQGDGGATIGLQHLLEAARRNIDMTLIVMNNLIYGMTGGQISGLSTNEFKTEKNSGDNAPPYDVCQLAHQAGASFATRVNQPKNITKKLVEAFKTPGFSLVEISSLCQPYGAKKIEQLTNWSKEEIVLKNNNPLVRIKSKPTDTLLHNSMFLEPMFESSIKEKIGIAIAGSAGGGVQSAAKLLAQAGIVSGLSASMKGEYPITVGTGFSVAEVILSKKEINYTGLEKPDVFIIVSDNGLVKVQNRIDENSHLYMDSGVSVPEHLNAHRFAFNKLVGKKGAALCAISYWIEESGLLELDALRAVAKRHKHQAEFLKAIDSSSGLALSRLTEPMN
jgi:2-oxoglutarate ferredoxin oxidoreductase subunit beta